MGNMRKNIREVFNLPGEWRSRTSDKSLPGNGVCTKKSRGNTIESKRPGLNIGSARGVKTSSKGKLGFVGLGDMILLRWGGLTGTLQELC